MNSATARRHSSSGRTASDSDQAPQGLDQQTTLTDRLAADAVLQTLMSGVSTSNLPNSLSSERADSGLVAPVRTGILNTTSIGTSGNFIDQDINGLLSGSAWGVTNIDYSFPTSGSLYGDNYPDLAPFNGFQVLSVAQQAVVRYAFSLISEYTLLTFTQITETSTSHAMIRLAGSSSPTTSYAYYPANTATGGDVFYGNIRDDSPTKAGYAFDSILHEIGHAVGLKHGQDDDLIHGVLPTNHNSSEWSIMDYHSYIGGDSFYRNSDGSGNQTYMSDDISALQYLYGANYASNGGSTIYTWSPVTGEEFINGIGQGASSTNTIYQSIWDGGGNDTYDLSAYSSNLSIDLDPGAWSTFSTSQLADLNSSTPRVDLAPGNVVNANEYNNDPRSLIENADGGRGNDTIIGNAGNNVLRGGAGNDMIFGEGGTDTAAFSGMASQYTLTYHSPGYYTIAGPDGIDQLHDIALLQFNTFTSIAIANLLVDYTIAASDADKADGVTATTPYVFTVKRTGDTALASQLDYSVAGSGTTPASGARFVNPTGSVSFAAGAATAVLAISVVGAHISVPETFTITLTGSLGTRISTPTATGRIEANDLTTTSYSIAPLDAVKADGTTGTTPYTFTVTRSGDTSHATTLTYAIAGAGTNPAPASLFASTTGNVAFAAGASHATISVNVNGASIPSSETFTVTIAGPSGTTISTATASGTIQQNVSLPTVALTDTTTGVTSSPVMTPYSGGTDYLQDEFVDNSGDNLNVVATTPDVFIVTGNGMDALVADSGHNVLYAGGGSNIMQGGTGIDTFFAEAQSVPTWNEVINFQAGDDITIWNVIASSSITWEANNGLSNYLGATALITDQNGNTSALTLAGFSVAQAKALTMQFGTEPAGNYMHLASPLMG